MNFVLMQPRTSCEFGNFRDSDELVMEKVLANLGFEENGTVRREVSLAAHWSNLPPAMPALTTAFNGAALKGPCSVISLSRRAA